LITSRAHDSGRESSAVDFNVVIFHQNIRSLRNKVDELLLSWDSEPDIVCFSEHWMQRDEVVHLVNFECVAQFCRGSSLGGGVCIYVNKRFKTLHPFKDCSENYNLTIEGHIEICIAFFEFQYLQSCGVRNNKLMVFCIYRPPSGDLETFFDRLENTLSRHCLKDRKIVLCGDLNIDLTKTNNCSRRLRDILTTHNIFNKVDFQTRVTSTSSSLLDVMCTNIEDTDCYPIDNGLSDHNAQILSLLIPIGNTFSNPMTKRNFSNKNIFRFCKLLKAVDWSFVESAETSMNNAFETFHNTIDSIFVSAFPIQKFYKRSGSNFDPKGWVTVEIKKQSSQNRDLALMTKIFDDPLLRTTLKIRKQALRNLINKKKSEYFAGLINRSRNKIKTMWDIVNTHTGDSRSRELPDVFVHDSKILTSQSVIVESFNNVFSDLPVDDKPISEINFTEIKADLELTFSGGSSLAEFQPTSAEEIIKALFSLRSSSSSGEDGISSNILKKCISPLMNPLCHLFNASLKLGMFPNIYKKAKVIPVYKKGDTSMITNYRPISLLCTFGKILERLVFWRISSFLESSRVFRNNQYGFRQNRSTIDCVESHLNEVISSLDKKMKVLNVSCDLSKAFDRVNHEILIFKLKHYGLRGPALDWFASYLSGRSQFTELSFRGNSVRSGCRTLKSGVPQGSILGPLLFLCFINDMNTNVPDTLLNLYADDANILVTGTENSLPVLSHQCLLSIQDWINRNRLVINCEKSVAIVFTTRNGVSVKPSLSICSTPVNYTEAFNFLGVWVDGSLGWSRHIVELSERLCKACYVLRNLRNIVDEPALRSAYFAYFNSILSYGIILWGCSGQTSSIFKIQKKAIRIISGKPPGYSCRNLFPRWRLLTVYDLYILKISIFVHRHLNEFNSLNAKHSYNTRHGGNLSYDRHCLALYEKKARYMGVRIWNGLPRSLRQISSEVEFRRELKLFLLQNNFYSMNDFFNI
jgi:exonuclease III